MSEEQMIKWLNWIVDTKFWSVCIKGCGGSATLQRSSLLMSQEYYKEHPEKCWLFEIGDTGYHDVFSAKTVKEIDMSSDRIIIVLRGE